MSEFILTLNCHDKPGIVAAVAVALSNADCNIEHAAQFNDPLSGQFFMRILFSSLSQGAEERFENSFTQTVNDYEMRWHIHIAQRPVKTLLMVSKQDHCLRDILYRWKCGYLPIDITAIVSNHENVEPLAKEYHLDFHYLPITANNKSDQEQALDKVISTTQTELIVLARYMQILSTDFCTRHAGHIINIHHSFLPGFKGARPYHQAYERGVKIIGATAHFATPDLDEGPIINQGITAIDHTHTPQKMELMGRDIETRTLRQAIELYCGRHIFLKNGRTIILQ